MKAIPARNAVDAKNVEVVLAKIKMNKNNLIIGVVALLFIASIIYFYPNDAAVEEVVIESFWKEAELTDVKTQEFFSIAQFDKPILIESFAVWCPTCKKQQDEIKKLISEGDDSIHISINTDPNENEEKVLEHQEKYSYDWRFAVFPAEAIQSLVNEFGVGVVNAPLAPVVLVCPDGSSRLLDSGVKTSDELKQEIATC